MTVVEAYGDFAEVLAKMAPEKIVDLKAPESMSDRVEMLVTRRKEGTITVEEKIELERYLSLDLLINLAKARAKGMLVRPLRGR